MNYYDYFAKLDSWFKQTFNISFADHVTGSWSQETTKHLEQITELSQVRTIFFPLDQELTVRFVKLMVVEVWGSRGGIHYFSENVFPAKGASYTGQECVFVYSKGMIFLCYYSLSP